MDTNKLICIIPARGGSRGIKDKNILLLDGLPLLVYPIMAAKTCNLISEVYVSTDSDKIKRIAQKYGAIVIDRPAELATDDALDIDVFKHAVKTINHYNDIVELRAITPLIDPAKLEEGIKYFWQHPDCTSMRSGNAVSQPVQKHFRKSGEYWEGYFPDLPGEYYVKPRQHFETSYIGNGYIDIVRPAQFMNSNSFLGNKILAFVTPRITDVDTIEDFEYLKYEKKRIQNETNPLRNSRNRY